MDSKTADLLNDIFGELLHAHLDCLETMVQKPTDSINDWFKCYHGKTPFDEPIKRLANVDCKQFKKQAIEFNEVVVNLNSINRYCSVDLKRTPNIKIKDWCCNYSGKTPIDEFLREFAELVDIDFDREVDEYLTSFA